MILPFSLTRPLTVADCETTSKNPKTARICELSITQFQPDGRVVDYHRVINPGVHIPPEMTAIHGIGDDDVIGAPRFCDLAPKLIRAFQGCDLAGHNVSYDFRVLREEFRRCGISTDVPEGQEPPRLIDTLRIWQVKEPRTLSAAVERFAGRAHEGAHGAKADVAGSIDALVGMYEAWPDLPRDVPALHALLWPKPADAVDEQGKFVWRDGEACISFGKYADRPLRAIPRGYLAYLLREGDLPVDADGLVRRALDGQYPAPPVAAVGAGGVSAGVEGV